MRILSPIGVDRKSELVGVGGWVSLMMAATVLGVLVVMVAWMVTWCISLLYSSCRSNAW